ncbi:MAG TPA: HAD hydrolase-like protein [Burkholderiales bacterium]|nr:HAD hydrolase-like protein [Burkholderiales bacterium]
MNYKLVVFDFDGTLADSMNCFLWAFRQVASRHGFRSVEDAEVEALRGFSNKTLMRHLGIPGWKVPFIATDMRKLMLSRVAEIQLFPGIPDMLRALHERGVRIAIVSSNSVETIRAVLGPGNVAYIDHFDCGTSLFGKNAKLKNLLRTGNLTPKQTLFVGDEIRDYEASKATFIPFVGVAWGYTRPDVLAQNSTLPLLQKPEDLLSLV